MQMAQDIPLTPEDLALIADGTGNVPDDTAVRLQAFILGAGDREQFERWRQWIVAQLEELRGAAAEADVELLADGRYVHTLLERLRAEPWDTPADLLDRRLDVPYQELIAMAGARADRAQGAETAEMRQLVERLVGALGDELGGEKFVQLLISRLLEVGEAAAEEALRQLVGIYRDRRAGAGEHGSRT